MKGNSLCVYEQNNKWGQAAEDVELHFETDLLCSGSSTLTKEQQLNPRNMTVLDPSVYLC